MQHQTGRHPFGVDPNLKVILNNGNSGHVNDDLKRYLYSSCLAKANGKSPTSWGFLGELTPNRNNWDSG